MRLTRHRRRQPRERRPRWLGTAAVALAWLAACGPEPVVPRHPAPSPPEAHGDAEITPLTRVEDIPLDGHFFSLARPGDFLLQNETTAAVVSSDDGRLIGFGPKGGRNGLYYVDPAVFDGFDAMGLKVAKITPLGSPPRVLHVERTAHGRDATLHTWLYLEGERITLESVLAATGSEPVLAVTLGEVIAWSNVPTWVEGYGFMDEGGTHPARFIGREAVGVAYAACLDEGPLLARFSSPGLPGFHRSPHTGERRIVVQPAGTSARRVLSLAHSSRSVGDAAMALPCAADDLPRRWPLPAEARTAGGSVELARCPAVGRVFHIEEPAAEAPPDGEPPDDPTEVQLEGPPPLTAGAPVVRFTLDTARAEVPLPNGCVRARLTAPGHAAGAWFDPDAAPEAGGFAPERALPRAGSLRFRITGTDGALLPAKLLVRGVEGTRTPDWGDDATDGAVRNFVYSPGQGARPLPPGKYDVSVHRGPEHTAEERRLEIVHGEETELLARLERVVDTRGWISADLHVHALPSADAPILLEDRVRSLAAVDVEVAVATDHNAVTDYGPAIRRLGLGERIRGVIGDEVTTSKAWLGHFNVFPLPAGSAPLEWVNTTPQALFATSRQRAPGSVIQVNHPRMGDIGYFELLHMDAGDVPGWLARSPMADMTFDAIEVFNGDHYAHIDAVRAVMHDWYALLNAGFKHVATGNSDSHKAAYHEAGVPRNWVAVADDRPDHLDQEAFIESVRKGRVIVSSGPFVQLRARGQGIGATVAAGEVDLEIVVDAPPWIEVSQVELVVRGTSARTWLVSGEQRPRFEKRLVAKLEAGDWIIVTAIGDRSMPHLYRRGAKPFAFTNPIWLK